MRPSAVPDNDHDNNVFHAIFAGEYDPPCDGDDEFDTPLEIDDDAEILDAGWVELPA